MADDSLVLILVINLSILLLVALIGFFLVKLKSSSESKDLNEFLENEEQDQENKKSPLECEKLEGEIEFLKNQIKTQQNRITNLGKFKQLYFKVDDLVQSETKRLRQSLLKIIDMSRDKKDRSDLLFEAENIFHSLKKMHPMLESIRPELFESEEVANSDASSLKNDSDEVIAKQLAIIESLQSELSKSKKIVAKLEYLERLARSSSDQNKKMKVELAKARSFAKHARHNQIKVKSLQLQLDGLSKKSIRDSDEKLSLNRKIAHMTDNIVAPTDPKDLDVSNYVESLLTDISKKQTELSSVREQYKQMENEYNRLFSKLESTKKTDPDSSEMVKVLREQLRNAEARMNETAIDAKHTEGELVTLSNNCDEVIGIQQKYSTIQDEYKMLAEGVSSNTFSDEHRLLTAQVKSLSLENQELKNVDKKLTESVRELERVRVEYSMLENEYIKLVEAEN